jgi:hypothetical protein
MMISENFTIENIHAIRRAKYEKLNISQENC